MPDGACLAGRLPARGGRRVIANLVGVNRAGTRLGERRSRDEWYENRHRTYEMRGEPSGKQAAFAQCLVDQPELELLEVAETAVDELA